MPELPEVETVVNAIKKSLKSMTINRFIIMNNKKLAIITGITGQDGSYLTELLDSKDYIIYGIIRRNSNINTKRINHLYKYESDKLILKYGDLTDTFCINNIITNTNLRD